MPSPWCRLSVRDSRWFRRNEDPVSPELESERIGVPETTARSGRGTCRHRCSLRSRIDQHELTEAVLGQPRRSSLQTFLGELAGRPFAAGTEPAFRSEVTLPGHEFHLDRDAFGIFEQDRVVAGSEPAVFGRVHDLRTQLVDDEGDRVDVLAPPRAEAQMVQTGATLIEGAAVLRIRIGA